MQAFCNELLSLPKTFYKLLQSSSALRLGSETFMAWDFIFFLDKIILDSPTLIIVTMSF